MHTGLRFRSSKISTTNTKSHSTHCPVSKITDDRRSDPPKRLTLDKIIAQRFRAVRRAFQSTVVSPARFPRLQTQRDKGAGATLSNFSRVRTDHKTPEFHLSTSNETAERANLATGKHNPCKAICTRGRSLVDTHRRGDQCRDARIDMERPLAFGAALGQKLFTSAYLLCTYLPCR